MFQLLWIGCLENEEEFKIKAKKGYNLASAQVSQQNLVRGIELISGQIFDSINGSVLPPYPLYEDRIIEPVIWNHAPHSFDISVGYRNDKYINRLTCKNSMLKLADKWIKERYKGDELIIFVYSMRSAPMATACRIKKLVPKARIYLIVTDLPQFMDLGENQLKAMLKKLDWIGIKKMQKQIDGFILYASKMAEFLDIPHAKWMLMEGSYDSEESKMCIHYSNEIKNKAIMYSGKLDREYGICLLLEAFKLLDDPDAELWLTGGGNAVEDIKRAAQEDCRIKFFGFLPSREDVLKKQQQASLLINMRLPSEPASSYCFPSKLFEYMATGVPVLSFKLMGIPEEYFQHLYLIKEESVDSVLYAIKEVFSEGYEKNKERGCSAQRFVLETKNSLVQCQNIWNYIMKNDTILGKNE